MIDFYFWPTPNGQKVAIMLEEVGLEYTTIPINILKGEQFAKDFLAISPNNKVPAIVDRADGPGGPHYPLFESGAILIYLADKTGQLMPSSPRSRFDVLQWLMFQMASVGPMFGQCGHFLGYAPEKIPYAIERYQNETLRLYKVMGQAPCGCAMHCRRLLNRRCRDLPVGPRALAARNRHHSISERGALVQRLVRPAGSPARLCPAQGA